MNKSPTETSPTIVRNILALCKDIKQYALDLLDKLLKRSVDELNAKVDVLYNLGDDILRKFVNSKLGSDVMTKQILKALEHFLDVLNGIRNMFAEGSVSLADKKALCDDLKVKLGKIETFLSV